MTITATDEAAEAICGALHSNEFQHTGEQRVRGHGIADKPRLWSYFVVGLAPQDVRVVVKRDEPFVVVTVSWRIVAMPKIVQTSVDFRIDCSPDRARIKLEESTQLVVEKCLEIYRDVLEAKGYASVDYLVKHRKA